MTKRQGVKGLAGGAQETMCKAMQEGLAGREESLV